MADNATADRELVLTRVVNAPRERVWKAFTDPKEVAVWWGPNGFSNTIHEMEVKVGGVWRFMMHGPDGVDYPNKIVYTKIVEPERLEYDHSGDGNPDLDAFKTSITFEDLGGKTKVTLRTVFTSVEERDRQATFAVEGGNQTLGRLADFVVKH